MKPYDGYSNRSENLEKAKIENFENLKVQIYKKKASILASECIIPLKSSVTLSELITPVRNIGCSSNPECIYDLEQILEFIKAEARKDGASLVYYCPNCIHISTSNKRLVDNLAFDRQISTLIALAKSKYKKQIKTDANMRKFKEGSFIFRKKGEDVPTCTYQITYKQKKSQQPVQYKFTLELGEKAHCSQQIKFSADDTININGMKSNFQKVISDQSKIVSQAKKFLQVATSVNLQSFQQQTANKLVEVIQKNLKIQKGVDYKYLTSEYTFSFSNKNYMEPQNSSFSLLNVYYPRLRLWRSYYLEYQDGKLYSHPEGALYLKNGYKIYIVGGYKATFPIEDKSKDQKQKLKYDQIKRTKQFTNLTDVIQIDLSNVISKVNAPTRQKMTVSCLGRSKAPKPIVDKQFKDPIKVRKLAQLPQNISNSAGLIMNNNIYMFSGCVLSNNGKQFKETITPKCYRYDINNNKWQSIKNLPSPRAYHSVFQYDNKIYIIGGSQQKDATSTRCNDESLKIVQIYNPNDDTFGKTEEFKSNHLSSLQYCNDGFRSRALPIRYPRDKDDFIFITGDRHNCYSFSPKTMMFSTAGYQAEFNTLIKQEKSIDVDSAMLGPKIQQIFDYNPPYVDGIYYYAAYSMIQKKSFVVYGTKGDWVASEQFDHGSTLKK